MKNNIFKIKHITLLLIIGVMVTFLSSCEDDAAYTGAISITKIYLQDAESDVPDREVSFARQGQLIRIEGSGFSDLRRVYINGLKSYFNPVMVSENSMTVSVSNETPIVDADSLERNTIRFENDGSQTTFDFVIRSSAPTISSISNTLPSVGEQIMVYGTGLLEVSSVIFPGDITVTNGITSDIEGEFFTVTMPEGVSEDGGAIFIECANGGAYSPAYFNFKKGVILDFDGNGVHGFWGSSESMILSSDLESSSIGDVNSSQGTYVAHRPVRIDTIEAGKIRNTEVWTAGNGVDDWRGQLSSYIPVETSVSDVAFQFDVYVTEQWSGTGYLKICLVNGFNGGEWEGLSYNFVPWVVDGEVVPFETTGWTTITIPFSEFYAFSDETKEYTFEDVLLAREAANYKNCGIYFENSSFTLKNITGVESDVDTEFLSSNTSVSVYTDNWRIVSTELPTYTDFPETEEE